MNCIIENMRNLQNDKWTISWMIKQYELILTNEKNISLPVELTRKNDVEYA